VETPMHEVIADLFDHLSDFAE
jgi:DNA-binding protein YbaB